MHHDLNCEASFFIAAKEGRKTFEIRYNDRGFNAGDTITLHELSSSKYSSHDMRTGDTIDATITYVLGWNQRDGWVVFSFRIEKVGTRQ
jgi:ASC-1-like (ASCH) protein